jgi:hypothetical protein
MSLRFRGAEAEQNLARQRIRRERFRRSLTLPEYIYATYNELLKFRVANDGTGLPWIAGFLRLRAWDARREQEKKKPGNRFI